jgi:hypothetical protein
MPKVNEFFVSFKIDLAKGEHLNFSSLLTLAHLKRILSTKSINSDLAHRRSRYEGKDQQESTLPLYRLRPDPRSASPHALSFHVKRVCVGSESYICEGRFWGIP